MAMLASKPGCDFVRGGEPSRGDLVFAHIVTLASVLLPRSIVLEPARTFRVLPVTTRMSFANDESCRGA
jgi:hypothetical protein